jgi:hypothetical protein
MIKKVIFQIRSFEYFFMECKLEDVLIHFPSYYACIALRCHLLLLRSQYQIQLIFSGKINKQLKYKQLSAIINNRLCLHKSHLAISNFQIIFKLHRPHVGALVLYTHVTREADINFLKIYFSRSLEIYFVLLTPGMKEKTSVCYWESQTHCESGVAYALKPS